VFFFFFFPHFFRRRFVEKLSLGSFVVPCVFKTRSRVQEQILYNNNMLEKGSGKEFVSLLKSRLRNIYSFNIFSLLF
jgi:hypothetical protein